jgi:two-component system NtrC family response regulator
MGRVLIIDDDEMMAKALSTVLRSFGHQAAYALTLAQGIDRASREDFDVVFLDVFMPDGSGLHALTAIRETPSQPEVIIITASGEPDGAELAIKWGAWDYLEKSSSVKDMVLPLARVFQYRQEKKARRPAPSLKRDNIIGSSLPMRSCLELVAQAAACDANVLIQGETGTGKELFARAIHDNSPRAARSCVVVDCTALPQTLVESVLFGHKKGAFTSADHSQDGLIVQADGGTLFLDEVGELPMDMQTKFLRVLQERRFRPVGAKEERTSNFRLVAATHRDLDRMVAEGTFRSDLLFRLRSLTIELPPLRERPEDIVELARFHVTRLCERYRRRTKAFSPEFLEAFKAYEWPGNIRELVHTVDGAVALAGDEPVLYCTHLPIPMRVRMVRSAISRKKSGDVQEPRESGPQSAAGASGELPAYREFRDSAEKEYLRQLITRARNDIQEASRLSGISRSRLYELLNKHQIPLGHAVRSAVS